MAPRKLSESDKQEILSAYRQSSDTTTTLASRYGVSTSTISRILKQSLPEQEYEDLVQQKRSGALRGQIEQEMLPGIEPELLEEPLFDESDESVEEADLEEADLIEVEAAPKRRRTPPVSRRQRKRLDNKRSNQSLIDVQSQLEVQDLSAGDAVVSEAVERLLPDLNREVAPPLGIEPIASLGLSNELTVPDLEDPEDDLDDEELDDLADDDLDDDDLDDDLEDDDEISGFDGVQIPVGRKIQVLPLSEASIPRICYVVVDRSSELITRPLKDFAELGQIPTGETQEKTLPIFDNHRIAKRFLRRMQRVVKVPDGRIFQKVRPYLQAKGITRLLIDGQIYSL